MKVSFVCGDGLPAGSRARREARALAAAGHTVTVHGVLGDGAEPEEDDGDVVLVRTKVPRWERPRSGLRGLLAGDGTFSRLRAVAEHAVRRDPPDAVHATGLDAAAPALDAARRLGVPFVFDDTGLDAPADGVGPHAAPGVLAELAAMEERVAAVERRVRRGATACISSSDALADDAAARFGGARPVVVRNCPALRKVRHGDALRTRLGIHPLDRIVVFHGPPDDAHGVEVAIRALRVLGDRVVLVVVGAAWCQDRLLGIAAEQGVLPQVRVLSADDPADVLRHLASAEVGVLPLSPSRRATRLGLPGALLDAFLAGLPVVVSDVPEAAGLVRRTGGGVVVRTGAEVDPHEIADGLRSVLADPDLRTGCAIAAQAAARRDLHWERESLRLVDLYDRISSSV